MEEQITTPLVPPNGAKLGAARPGFVGRALASMRRRGFLDTIDIALAVLQDKVFDPWYGTDTASAIYLDALSIESPNKTQGIEYVVSRGRSVRKLIRRLGLPIEGTFVDFGCGKGRVLLLAAQCGFSKIVGVEFSPELCQTARANIAAFRKKTRTDADIRIVEGDAAAYPIGDSDRVFYFFFPFRAPVMEQVMENIGQSLASHDRESYLVYSQPCRAPRLVPACQEFREVIERDPRFSLFGEYSICGSQFLVYKNRRV
jgi:SAM-dependent methyltransferase